FKFYGQYVFQEIEIILMCGMKKVSTYLSYTNNFIILFSYKFLKNLRDIMKRFIDVV
ncbi:hypothetical protein L9F63_013134, partial [Diploptera punctata]